MSTVTRNEKDRHRPESEIQPQPGKVEEVHIVVQSHLIDSTSTVKRGDSRQHHISSVSNEKSVAATLRVELIGTEVCPILASIEKKIRKYERELTVRLAILRSSPWVGNRRCHCSILMQVLGPLFPYLQSLRLLRVTASSTRNGETQYRYGCALSSLDVMCDEQR